MNETRNKLDGLIESKCRQKFRYLFAECSTFLSLIDFLQRISDRIVKHQNFMEIPGETDAKSL